jgi:hypothetical protein
VTEKAAPTTRNPSDPFTCRAVYGSADGWLFGIDPADPRTHPQRAFGRVGDSISASCDFKTLGAFFCNVARPPSHSRGPRRNMGLTHRRQRSDAEINGRRVRPPDPIVSDLSPRPIKQPAARAPRASARERRAGTLSRFQFIRKIILKFLQQTNSPSTRPAGLRSYANPVKIVSTPVPNCAFAAPLGVLSRQRRRVWYRYCLQPEVAQGPRSWRAECTAFRWTIARRRL